MHISKLILTVLCLVMSSGPLYAKEFYVSPNGGMGTGSKSDPWSLRYANTNLKAGDTAILQGGIYTDGIDPTNSGRLDSNGNILAITYTAYQAETPIISRGKPLSGWVLYSGTEGVDAIYRKTHGWISQLRHDTYDVHGRNTMLWNRGTGTRPVPAVTTLNKFLSTARPAEFYHSDGFLYVRTVNSDNPSNYKMVAILDKSTAGISVVGKQYITIDRITVQDVSRYVDGLNASYITVKNCKFSYASKWAAIALNNSSWFRILNNTIEGGKSINQHDGEAIELTKGSTYNLIKGNDISWTSHAAMRLRDNSNYNFIFNNYVHNVYGKILQIDAGSRFNTVEHNQFIDSPIAAKLVLQHNAPHSALNIGESQNIIRFNKFYKNAIGLIVSPGKSRTNIKDVAIYNNTFFQSSNVSILLQKNSSHVYDIESLIIVNNILSDDTSTSLDMGGVLDISTVNAKIENNLFYSSAGSTVIDKRYSAASFESTYPSKAQNNNQFNPLLVVKTGDPLVLQPQDQDIVTDTRQYLTKTIGSGVNSTKITIGDARYFTDGYGVVPGDDIKVGSNLVTITNVDYTKNVITVNSSISWNDGTKVGFRINTLGGYNLYLPTTPTNLILIQLGSF